MSDVNLIAMFVVRVCGFQDFNLALEKSVFPPMNQDDKKIPGKYIASPCFFYLFSNQFSVFQSFSLF
jgi:hypothetical protein